MALQTLNLTSADISAHLATVSTFPVGFALENFAEGDAVSVAGVNGADMVKGIDGGAGYWYIPTVKEVQINLMPGSRCCKNLLLLAQANETARNPDLIQLVITIPAMNLVVTFIDGVMTSYPPMPGIQNRLQNMPFSFKFREVVCATL